MQMQINILQFIIAMRDFEYNIVNLLLAALLLQIIGYLKFRERMYSNCITLYYYSVINWKL